MKVTGVDVHIVSVPFAHPETWRFGRMVGAHERDRRGAHR
jgi:hypothetical protein